MKPTEIETLNGGTFDFAGVLAGESQRYDLSEIAWCLCHTPRYVSHTRTIITVGEHSSAVALRADQLCPGAGPAGFVHDWHEFVLCDLPSPLKKLLRLHGDTVLVQLAAVIDLQIRKRFGIEVSPEILRAVKQADREACAWEKKYIRNSEREWSGIPKLPESVPALMALMVCGLNPDRAEHQFWKSCDRWGIKR